MTEKGLINHIADLFEKRVGNVLAASGGGSTATSFGIWMVKRITMRMVGS